MIWFAYVGIATTCAAGSALIAWAGVGLLTWLHNRRSVTAARKALQKQGWV